MFNIVMLDQTLLHHVVEKVDSDFDHLLHLQIAHVLAHEYRQPIVSAYSRMQN